MHRGAGDVGSCARGEWMLRVDNSGLMTRKGLGGCNIGPEGEIDDNYCKLPTGYQPNTGAS